ncbi:MAG: ferredoxin [Patescibacteria group bacterium]|nr:ferredoxin [Patescibacteria group bacterium]
MAKFKIEVDQEKCISCGACTTICPDNFELKGEDNKSFPKNSELDVIGCSQEAADACPVQCIKISKI